MQKRLEREKKRFAFPKMDVSPAITEVGGYGHNIPAEETDNEEDEDVCRICRSPKEPENPLRYPCLCRGSIKYVHQDCLRLWLNRRGIKQCEVIARLLFFKTLWICDFDILGLRVLALSHTMVFRFRSYLCGYKKNLQCKVVNEVLTWLI